MPGASVMRWILCGVVLAIAAMTPAHAAWKFHFIGGYGGDDGVHAVAYARVPDDWDLSDPSKASATPFMVLVYYDRVRPVPDHADRIFNELNVQGEVNCSGPGPIKIENVFWQLVNQPDGKDMDEWAEQNYSGLTMVQPDQLGPMYVRGTRMICGLDKVDDEPLDDNEVDVDAAMALDFGFDNGARQ